MIFAILAGIFISVTLLTTALLIHYRNKELKGSGAISKRLQELERQNTRDGESDNVFRDKKLSDIPVLDKLLKKLRFAGYLANQIEQADVNLKVGQLVLLIMIFGVGGYLFSMRSDLLVLRLLAGVICALLPLLYLTIKKLSRLKAFIREFPDAIDMMVSALKAGHAFSKAMQIVAAEAPEPIAGEFRKTYEENSLGVPIKEALQNLANRIDHIDLKLFVTAVLLQRETGGNLAEILEKISYTIRERFKLMGQIKVFTAQGRFSAIIISALPIGFAVIITFINPEYLEPLFTTKAGHILLGLAVFLETTGFLVIRKITNIKLN